MMVHLPVVDSTQSRSEYLIAGLRATYANVVTSQTRMLDEVKGVFPATSTSSFPDMLSVKSPEKLCSSANDQCS